MTLEQVKAMTNSELNYKIAMLLGGKWIRLENKEPKRSLVMPTDSAFSAPAADGTEQVCQIHFLSRFSSKLDEMHDAEMSLDPELAATWMANLSLVVHGTPYYATVNMMQATARQRAEAFVLTVVKS